MPDILYIVWFACPPLAGVGGGRFNVAVMFSEVADRKFFIHLRHCVTPPPAEDMVIQLHNSGPAYEIVSQLEKMSFR